jgi:GT2 family glycosyltransferase
MSKKYRIPIKIIYENAFSKITSELISMIYILLPIHNRRISTQRFISCLKRQSYKDYTLVLIDDGSTDGTEEMVRSQISSLKVIKGKGDWWWAGALQQGYSWLKRKEVDNNSIILIINDDTVFPDNFLERGEKILNDTSDSLLLAQCYSRQTNKLIDSGVYADWEHFKFTPVFEPDRVNCLSTNGLFIKWKDFQAIGGFRPKLLPHYTSDYEFTIRAHRIGMKLVTHPELKLYLDEETTGYRQFKTDNFWEFLSQYFSKKSAVNPITLSIFIALSCPWRWKLLNWLRVWRAAKHQIQKFWIQTNL